MAKPPKAGSKRNQAMIDIDDDQQARVLDAGQASEGDAGDPEQGTDADKDASDDEPGVDDVIELGGVGDELGFEGSDDVAFEQGADDGDGTSQGRRGALVKSNRGAAARRDPLDAYMAEVRRFPLLTVEEEHALAVRLAETGDTVAARRLVEANLRLVVKIAYEYKRAHRNLLDLVQEGNIGLMQAVSKYDPYRGVKLSSYAAFWIRAYILKFILNNWRLVKIGTTQAQRKLFFNLRKERERLEQLGFAPTSKMLADNLDVTESEVVEMEKRLAAPEASLDAPAGGEDDGGRTRLDYVPSSDERPDQAVANNEFATLLRAKLEEFASELEGRDQHIFRERWLTDEPQTLQEIGDKYGVSRERARQLERRMLDRLRKFLESELGSAVDIGAMASD